MGHREEDFGDLNAAVEKEVEAVNPSASVEEEVGTGDTRAAVEKEVGAENKGAAEEEEVGARDKGAAEEEEVGAGDKNVEDSRPSVAGRFPDFSTTATRVTEVRASDVFNEDNDSGLEVEQQSTWAASEEQGGQGSLQSSPRSTGDQLTAAEVSSDQEYSSSLPSPSKMCRRDSPIQVLGRTCIEIVLAVAGLFTQPGPKAKPSHGIDVYVCVCLSPPLSHHQHQKPGSLGTLWIPWTFLGST